MYSKNSCWLRKELQYWKKTTGLGDKCIDPKRKEFDAQGLQTKRWKLHFGNVPNEDLDERRAQKLPGSGFA